MANIRDKHLLVGVSGGLDSMTLLTLLLSLSRILKLKLSVVYVHHGSTDKKQKAFQDKALILVKNFCLKNQLGFYSNGLYRSHLKIPYIELNGPRYFDVSATEKHVLGPDRGSYTLGITPQTGKKKQLDLKKQAQNEAKMRAFRYHVFLKYFKKSQAHFLALAHTAEDLLETRLLRLIRGTGDKGLKAMCFKRGQILRPFIHINRSHILDFANYQNSSHSDLPATPVKTLSYTWCEDPTNQSTQYSLRNWLRKEWLPALEKRSPGGLKAMGRSLHLLTYYAEENQVKTKQIAKALIKNGALKRDQLLTLPLWTKQKILAYYLREQGIKNYSLNHIKELLKQLERKQKKFQFSLLKKTWKIQDRWLTYTQSV